MSSDSHRGQVALMGTCRLTDHGYDRRAKSLLCGLNLDAEGRVWSWVGCAELNELVASESRTAIDGTRPPTRTRARLTQKSTIKIPTCKSSERYPTTAEQTPVHPPSRYVHRPTFRVLHPRRAMDGVPSRLNLVAPPPTEKTKALESENERLHIEIETLR